MLLRLTNFSFNNSLSSIYDILAVVRHVPFVLKWAVLRCLILIWIWKRDGGGLLSGISHIFVRPCPNLFFTWSVKNSTTVYVKIPSLTLWKIWANMDVLVLCKLPVIKKLLVVVHVSVKVGHHVCSWPIVFLYQPPGFITHSNFWNNWDSPGIATNVLAFEGLETSVEDILVHLVLFVVYLCSLLDFVSIVLERLVSTFRSKKRGVLLLLELPL